MSAGAAPSPDLRLRIERAIIPAADRAAVSAAIAAVNARAHRPGLPDSLNPEVIDPAKADALMSALLRPPSEAVHLLAGRALWLDAAALRIGTSSPTTVAGFAGAVKLDVVSEHGETVSARAVVPIDCTIARNRASDARSHTEDADRKYKAATGDAIMPVRLLRYALARAWFDNADARAACDPGDANAAADRDAADKMLRASVVIGGSME